MIREPDDSIARAQALAESNRRIAAALRYLLDRSKRPEDLAPFLAGAAAMILDILRSDDYFARKVIDNALAIAEADAAEIAADSVQLNGAAPLARLRRSAEDALRQITPARPAADPNAEPDALTEEERAYIVSLAKLAELAGKDPYVR